MKADTAPQKAKTPPSLPLPTREAQAAAFARLPQKDRDNFERQAGNATAKGTEKLAATWRRLAGVGLALCSKPPKISGLNTIQFFIADGNYRKQVYAMHLSDTGEVTVFLPDILADAIKAKLVTPLPKDPAGNAYTTGKGGERLIIDPYDRDTTNPQPYFKDMTGWNRKAIGVVLPPDASEALVHTTEQLMALASTWPAPVSPA
jgi:hypothetical protein